MSTTPLILVLCTIASVVLLFDVAAYCITPFAYRDRPRYLLPGGGFAVFYRWRFGQAAVPRRTTAAARTVVADVEAILSGLSYQDRERILQNLVWDVFGDVDDDGEPVFIPGRMPDRDECKNIVGSLRDEFFPAKE